MCVDEKVARGYEGNVCCILVVWRAAAVDCDLQLADLVPGRSAIMHAAVGNSFRPLRSNTVNYETKLESVSLSCN